MQSMDADVVNVSIVDSQEKAQKAIDVLLDNKVEMLFVFISTYALSSTILPIVQRCKVPILLLKSSRRK